MRRQPPGQIKTNLLLPGLQLFNQKVIALGDLAQLSVHTALEVNKVLPSLHGIARVLVALAHNLVEMAHGNLGHQRFLDTATEDRLHSGVASQLLADMVHNTHHGILVPPRRFLDIFDLSSHDDDLARRDEFTASVGRPQVIRNTGWRHITIQRLR